MLSYNVLSQNKIMYIECFGLSIGHAWNVHEMNSSPLKIIDHVHSSGFLRNHPGFPSLRKKSLDREAQCTVL